MSSGGYSGGFGGGQPSFGGGFGVPQQPSFGGGFGMPQQPQFGGFQQPQFGGGFGQFQPPQFGGDFGQRGPGNAYARPFPQMQPVMQPMSPFANPSTGVMPSEPLRDPGAFTGMLQDRPALSSPELQTGGGYPSRDQVFETQVFQPQIAQRYDPRVADLQRQQQMAQAQIQNQFNQLGSGLGSMFGGYFPMPYGGYQPMGGYRMFQF